MPLVVFLHYVVLYCVMLTKGDFMLCHALFHCILLTESRMLPNTRLAPMPAKPAALPKALEGTRRSLNFFFTSSFCSLICKQQQRNTHTVNSACCHKTLKDLHALRQS